MNLFAPSPKCAKNKSTLRG